MVRTRHPEGVVALHAMVAYQQILQGVVERVTDMEHAGYIRRRDDDGKGLFTLLHGRSKCLVLHPVVVPALLYFGEFISFR